MRTHLIILASLVVTGCSSAPQTVTSTNPAEISHLGANVCPPHRGAASARPDARDATAAEKASFLEMMRKSPTGRSIADQFSLSMSDAAAKRKNTTRMSHDSSHGTQISYSAADGSTFLWYAGNNMVLKGVWRACEDRFGVTVKGAQTTTIPFGKLCFKYGPGTYNPATGSKGDEWECAAASTMEARLVEQRPGDVFELSKRTAVPFVLSRDKTNFAVLLARMPKNKKP